MKRGVLYILILSSLLFFGCQKEKSDIVGECGITGNAKFTVRCALAGMAVKSSIDEELVDDINLYVVNDLGDVVVHKYCTKDSLESEELSCHNVNMDMQEGMEYAIYIIANSGGQFAATTLSELENFVYVISEIGQISSDRGAVLMSGYREPTTIANGETVTVNLERCISKIVIKADYSQLNEDVTISVNSVALKNIPDRMQPFGINSISDSAHVIESEPITGFDEMLVGEGILFYQYENRQGTLQPDNTDYTKKVWPEESQYSKVCSYIELEAAYSSSRKKGAILYRFYLGADMVSNYDVIRNTEYYVTIFFIGDGAVEENTWRVDNSAINDLVTEVLITPDECSIIGLGNSKLLSAEVMPHSAADKTLQWRSSDSTIAIVDNSGSVTSVAVGECLIVATSTDGSSISDTCRLSVTNPVVAFEEEGCVMYDGEVAQIPFHLSGAESINAEIFLSNGNAELVSLDSGSITVRAVTPGECRVTAVAGESSDTYILDIQKLTIVASDTLFVAYNHFYHDVGYTITPPHAAGLGVIAEVDKQLEGHVTVSEGARMLVSVDETQEYPNDVYTVTLSVNGREDVYTETNFSIKESSVDSCIKLVSNFTKDNTISNIVINTSPRAFESMEYTVEGVSGEYVELGNFDDNVKFSFGDSLSEVSIANPCGVNGRYELELLTVGDDRSIVRMNSTVEIYEMIYVTALSKSAAFGVVSQSPFVREYVNEVVIKAYSHPSSLFFSNGEIGSAYIDGFEYEYKGETYSNMHPDIYETHIFVFEQGVEYPLFPSGVWVFDGNTVPQTYMEFFSINISTPWLITESGYLLYLYSREFSSGFCDYDVTWTAIFDVVYPY